MLWSASALKRHCAFPNVLGRDRVQSPETVLACERGTRFHALAEQWIKTRSFPDIADAEILGWLELLASQWQAPPDALTEVAWGLDKNMQYVDVVEPEPHKYVAADGKTELLTAGRADVAYRDHWHPDILRIVDWKTGRWATTPAQHNLQVHAAGVALTQKLVARSYMPGIYYVRDGWFDWGDPVEFVSGQYMDMVWEIREAALLPEEPRPGPHCATCWERKRCGSAAHSPVPPPGDDYFPF